MWGRGLPRRVLNSQRPLVWYNPTHWFVIGREWVAGPFIKLTKPFNPVKPQRLNENNQASRIITRILPNTAPTMPKDVKKANFTAKSARFRAQIRRYDRVLLPAPMKASMTWRPPSPYPISAIGMKTDAITSGFLSKTENLKLA